MASIYQGQHVRLRAIEPADWEIFYNWDSSDSDHARSVDEIWFPSSRVQMREWAERETRRGDDKDAFRFAIEELNGQLVGTLNTHSCNPRCGTFMYGLAVLPPYQRRGYASEAITLVLRYYFLERRYQKVTVEVFSFNTASIRLHERLGFKLEGRLRRMVYTGGKYYDALMYGQTAEEFAARGDA